MPVADDPGRANGRVLLDGSGRELARFAEVERDDRRVADLFSLAADVEPVAAVPAVMAELAGWRVAAEEPFGRMLVAAGGRPKRHGHVMSRDLVRDPAPTAWLEPPLPAGMRLTGVDRPALDLAPACLAAYPREHPDFDHIPTPERPEVELEEIMSGRMMGPLLRCSGLAVGEDGAVLGAVLINGTAGEPPTGGPWISQLFRHPEARGAGGPLLRRALALAGRDGLPAVGLAVTDGNPALRLYEEHGFAEILNSLTVEL
jgi:GNAT superfamily N-acetyltransferase